jgi:competence protein ComEC
MAAVFLGAFAFRCRPDLLNSLGAVLLILMLWNGHLLFQPGVQLSYGVVAAIAIGLAWTTKTFDWMARPELYLPNKMMNRAQRAWLWLRRWAAGTMAVSLAAGIGSAPLTILHFGIVTPVSVIASLVLLPLVFVLLAAALFSAAVFSVSPAVSHGMNRLNEGVAELCAMAAGGFASLPGGHHFIGHDKRARLMIYDLEYGAGAACFTDGKGAAVMIDCGSSGSLRYLVAPSLRKLGIVPDAVVLSHPDGGHLGGGSQVWQTLPVRQAWLPVSYARSPSCREWLEQAPKHGIRVIHGNAGDKLPFPDGAFLEVLHLPDPALRQALADERVAVFRLHWHGWKILLTSDAGMGTELRMLDAGTDVSADVIIAGRNRTDVSLCDRFIDAVNPRAIVASNPPYPESERLPPASVAYWRSRDIQVIDQGVAGGVTLSVDENGALVIEGFLTDKPLVLTGR